MIIGSNAADTVFIVGYLFADTPQCSHIYVDRPSPKSTRAENLRAAARDIRPERTGHLNIEQNGYCTHPASGRLCERARRILVATREERDRVIPRLSLVRGTLTALLMASTQVVTSGQVPPGSGARMAPLAQYLAPNKTDEINLARSAAPPAISQDAEILTLGPNGYETAVKGKNGFVCLVERAWAAAVDSSSFWNPKIRGPDCYNPAAARSVLPSYLKRTGWVLAGLSQAEIAERTRAALMAHETPLPEVGSMSYMLSREGYLNDEPLHHWRPHLMFFVPQTPAAEWGANLEDSPVLWADFSRAPVTVFLVPVSRWSDGTAE